MRNLVIGILASATLGLGILSIVEHRELVSERREAVDLRADGAAWEDITDELSAEVRNLTAQVDYWHRAWHDATVSISEWRQRFDDVTDKYTSLYARVHSQPAPYADCPWDRAVHNAYGQVIGCRPEPSVEVRSVGTDLLELSR